MSNIDVMRPDTWNEFIGQENMKRRLAVHIEACRKNTHPLDHTLLTGPPGFGKTTIAQIIAETLGEDFVCVTMPIREIALTRLVRTFSGVLLLDEIHRAAPRLQEELLPLLEFGYVQDRRGNPIHSDWLTVVGATTEAEKVIPPLYDRFMIKPAFEAYSPEEMAAIVQGMAKKASVRLDAATARIFGSAAGGTPRNARQLVLAYRDMLSSGRKPKAKEVLDLVGVDENGLTTFHYHYLEALERLGGQAGLEPLTASLRLHKSIVMDLERLLVQHGLIQFTERGRELIGSASRKRRS